MIKNQHQHKNESFITIGGKRFHYTWLRDHCLSTQSRNPDSGEKLDDPRAYPYPPKPLSVEEQDGKLIIEWDEKPSHQSIFPISWLLSHAYDPQKLSKNQ